MKKNFTRLLVLSIISLALFGCEAKKPVVNEPVVNEIESMELLVQDTQKKLKIDKNQEEIQEIVNSISNTLEKSHKVLEIDLKPDYILYINNKEVLYWTVSDDIVVSAYNNKEKKLVDYHLLKDNNDYIKIKKMLDNLTKLLK